MGRRPELLETSPRKKRGLTSTPTDKQSRWRISKATQGHCPRCGSDAAGFYYCESCRYKRRLHARLKKLRAAVAPTCGDSTKDTDVAIVILASIQYHTQDVAQLHRLTGMSERNIQRWLAAAKRNGAIDQGKWVIDSEASDSDFALTIQFALWVLCAQDLVRCVRNGS